MPLILNGTTGVSGVDGSAGTPSYQGTDTNTGIFYPAADTIAFAEGGAEIARFDSSGRLLLGTTAVTTSSSQSGEIYSTGAVGFMMTNTTAANYPLSVKNEGTSGTRNLINFYEGAAGGTSRANISFDSSNNFAFASTNATTFSTASAERMRITSGGVVGIGSTSPVSDRALTLNSTSNYFGIAFQTSGTTRGQIIQESTGNIYVDAGSDGGSGALVFRTTGTERMRITSGGSLLLGTTTEQAPITAVFSSSGAVLSLDRTSNIDGTLRDMVQFRRSVTSVGSITCSNTATAYNTSSDYRLKENIAPMVGALDKVSQLKPCTYKWKIDGSHGEGFIAHELAEVLPNAVSGEKDAVNEEGNPVYQGVDTSFLVATLTAAIQEQQAMIEELTNRIKKLEGV